MPLIRSDYVLDLAQSCLILFARSGVGKAGIDIAIERQVFSLHGKIVSLDTYATLDESQIWLVLSGFLLHSFGSFRGRESGYRYSYRKTGVQSSCKIVVPDTYAMLDEDHIWLVLFRFFSHSFGSFRSRKSGCSFHGFYGCLTK